MSRTPPAASVGPVIGDKEFDTSMTTAFGHCAGIVRCHLKDFGKQLVTTEELISYAINQSIKGSPARCESIRSAWIIQSGFQRR